MFEFIFLLITAYLLGSISSAIITCRLFGLQDPRSLGSKNPGATNVLRIGGTIPAIITLLGDALKGFIPTIIAKMLGAAPSMITLILLSALIGHMWPIFFKFKGGKGVATVIGGLFGLSYLAGLGYVGVWLAVFGICRISSLSALIATAIMPFAIYYSYGLITSIPIMITAFLIIYRHKSNIKNLKDGKEK